MRPELDAALCRDFPLLYRNRNGSPRDTCMCWGFCVGDGWEPIIRELSEKLEPMCAAWEGPDDERPCAGQVKEKFGGLRFYMDWSETEMMTEAIDEAERKSFLTCEECGEPGRLQKTGWWKVLCGKCKNTEDK